MQSFTKPTRVALIGGVAGAAVLGAVALGGTAFAETATRTPSASSSASAPAAGDEQGRQHAPHIGGEVRSVSGSTVVVEDREGFTRTIALADDVTVTQDGAAAEASAIAAGEHVEASGAVAADGTTLDATEVRVGEPSGRGPGDGRGPGAEGGHGGPGGRHGEARDDAGDGSTTAPTPEASADAS